MLIAVKWGMYLLMIPTKQFLKQTKKFTLTTQFKNLLATPNARLKSGPILLTAERIEYDTNTVRHLQLER